MKAVAASAKTAIASKHNPSLQASAQGHRPHHQALRLGETILGEHGLSFGSREDLISKPPVVEFYDKLIRDLTKDLAQFEKIKRVTLLAREFTLEAGELTPTLKVKRRFVEQKYKDVIDTMYEGSTA